MQSQSAQSHHEHRKNESQQNILYVPLSHAVGRSIHRLVSVFDFNELRLDGGRRNSRVEGRGRDNMIQGLLMCSARSPDLSHP